ncbi:hypothetical protein KA012_04715 [Candidatus Woesebacteria bacterium]|nr:hypothetical protein [Candidatus Woesebacteria bacterium]
MADIPVTSSISVAIAGSTRYTRWCAEALASDSAFRITRVLTPTPKPIGRKKLITENPLHQWAQAAAIPTTLISDRVDRSIKTILDEVSERPDILLVVDFGYFIPKWLLEWPKAGPLNIHPSDLPRWRGSSPGQFPILYGDRQSAISLMIMNEEFDAGPLLTKIPFAVQPTWTALEYYQHAFTLMTEQLPSLLEQFVSGGLVAETQPEESPTAIAGKMSREDGFVSWTLIQALLDGAQMPDQCGFNDVSPILLDTFSATENIYLVVERAVRALSPWPGVWTKVPTADGDKRLKILSASLSTQTSPAATSSMKLALDRVQIEGKQSSSWNDVKQIVKK